MKCDTFSSNFYQHHNFYNILLAWQNTYKLDRWPSALLAVNSLQGCRECRLRFAISIPKDKYYTRGEQRRMILFFQVLNYFLCWFASRLWNILLWGKYTQLSADHRVSWLVPDLVSYPPFPSGSGTSPGFFQWYPRTVCQNQLHVYHSLPIRFHAAEKNTCLKNYRSKVKAELIGNFHNFIS